MIKKYFSFLVSLLLVASLTACSPTPEEAPTELPAKEVSIFIVNQGNEVTFSKSGEVTSASQALIMPETSGRVTNIPVKLGQKVRKGQTLIALGNSMSSEITNLNYETALKGIEKLNDTLVKMDNGAQTDIRSAILGYYTAREAVLTAIENRDASEELYDDQQDTLDDNIDSLKDTLDALKKAQELQASQDPTTPVDTSTYQKTLASYEQLKSQQDQAELGNEISTNQTDFGINSARRQLEGAILGVESLQSKYGLQFIQVESSLLQAQNGADIAALQKEALNIKSPINGTVTSIDATLNNTVAPGQIVATVQNLDSMEIKTSVNGEELPLVKVGDKVTVGKEEGEISEVSPSLSASNKKIDVKIALAKTANLLSGELVTVEFHPQTQSIFVPLKTVAIEDTKYFVKLIDSNKTITKQEVKAGKILGTFIEITEGIKQKDIIAFSDSTFIQDGDKVVFKVPRT